MLDMIGEARTCPHGHPIGDYPREPECPDRRPDRQRGRILRFENEDHDLLRMFRRAGVELVERYTIGPSARPGQAGGTPGRDRAAPVRGQDDLGGGRAVRRGRTRPSRTPSLATAYLLGETHSEPLTHPVTRGRAARAWPP